MPFYEHSDLSPLKDDLHIWRYLTFAKFVSLISSGTLYCARPDKFGDSWEGVPQQAILDTLAEHFQKTIQWTKEQTCHFFRNKIIPRRFVSCWHLNENESAAMWRLYGKNEEAIAVKTTVGRLKESLRHEPRNFIIGQVAYGNHREWQLPPDIKDGPVDKWTAPFLFKRSSFEHEKEVRLIIAFNSMEDVEAEYKANVNISKLIENIYVSPQSGEWFVEAVKSALSKYGYDGIEVVHSSLDDERIL
jgi:hypothetical protein